MRTLTWKVTGTRPTACPDYQPDPYTGQYPSTHCLVYHFESYTEDKVKEFENEEEAVSFAAKAPDCCSDFKLDGKLLEDKRPKASSTTYSTDLVGSRTATVMSGTNILIDETKKESK